MAEAKNESRTPRELTTREKEARYEYKPASTLPTPNPEPGYAFHWVATHILGQSDPTNVSRKFRDGFVPCKAADYPELMIDGNEKTGNVEVGGLMLCKISIEKAKAMTEYYDKQARAQMESVDNTFMRANDPRMPLFSEKKSTVTRGVFGSGTK